jgi:hypothetical protein
MRATGNHAVQVVAALFEGHTELPTGIAVLNSIWQ